MIDHCFVTNATQLIRSLPADKPWFVAVGFRRPHLPWTCTAEDCKHFEGRLCSFAASCLAWPPLRDAAQVPPELGDPQAVRAQAVRAYYACVRQTDRMVGKLLYGDISAKTDLERMFSIVCMLFGVSWYAFVVSTISSILGKLDRRNAEVKRKQSLLTMVVHKVVVFAESIGSGELPAVSSALGRDSRREPVELELDVEGVDYSLVSPLSCCSLSDTYSSVSFMSCSAGS